MPFVDRILFQGTVDENINFDSFLFKCMINKTCIIGLNNMGAMTWKYSANHALVSSSTFVNDKIRK